VAHGMRWVGLIRVRLRACGTGLGAEGEVAACLW
jgi:hypothetical protein